MNSGPLARDIAGMTFLVLSMGGLIAVNFWILQPFLPALIWSTIIVVATWQSCSVYSDGWGISVRSP